MPSPSNASVVLPKRNGVRSREARRVRLFAREAFLPDGWAPDVTIDVSPDGTIAAVAATAPADAAADVTRKGDKLVLTSPTPKEWGLEQETGDQYLVKSKYV